MVSKEYQQQLEELAEKLVTPERYGKVAVDLALLPGDGFDLPETARIYQFPQMQMELPDIPA